LRKERHFVSTQGKWQPRKKKLVAAVDDFDEEVVKRHIYSFYVTQQQRPILKSPLRVVCGNAGFQGGRTSARKLAMKWVSGIKHIFVHKTISNIVLLLDRWMFTHFLFCRWRKTSGSQRVIVERSSISFENGLAQRNTEILTLMLAGCCRWRHIGIVLALHHVSVHERSTGGLKAPLNRQQRLIVVYMVSFNSRNPTT
jgi:hypothetical protein